MFRRAVAPLIAIVAIGFAEAPRAQTPSTSSGPKAAGADLELVEKLLTTRKEYQKVLEQLRVHYLKAGDLERSKWAEEELRQYHRISHNAYRLELDVPPPNLSGNANVTEANQLFMLAVSYKDKGWGNDYIDNQRRAEILFQKILSEYPQSNKIDDAAYMLGDIYESNANKQYRRAAAYFERCVQWNPRTQMDARLRAAHLYDRKLNERAESIRLYREITTHETDARRYQEATKRLAELSGSK